MLRRARGSTLFPYTTLFRSGVADRVRFEVASAKDYAQDGYDLVTFFDCLHDMGDPVGAAVHARRALADGGTVMLVEDRKSTRLNSSHRCISYAVFCLKKKKK